MFPYCVLMLGIASLQSVALEELPQEEEDDENDPDFLDDLTKKIQEIMEKGVLVCWMMVDLPYESKME